MSKVAIVTLYDDINIGNKLQNYALQELLNERFSSVTTLSYSEAKSMAPDMGWKGKCIAKLGIPRRIAIQKRAIIERRRKFEKFSQTYLHVLQPKPFTEFNSSISEQYDYIVVGSDQVWHNWSNSANELDYFFLKFAPKEKRVCIAPSFGLSNLPTSFAEKYKEGLLGFETLSCREISGCDLIAKAVQKKAKLLPDPTLCITRNGWNKIAKQPSYQIPNRYILAYFIGGVSESTKMRIEEFKRMLEIPVIDIYNIEEPQYYSTSPDEFVYMISNAEYVLTNSFHATVFSIIFHVNFHCFDRDDKIGEGMSDRIQTLLHIFQMDNNLICNDFTKADDIQRNVIEEMQQYMNSVFMT